MTAVYIYNCDKCGKKFMAYASTKKNRKMIFCSLECKNRFQRENEIKPPSRKGHKYTEEERWKHSLSQRGEKNHNWKGGVKRWRSKNLEYKLWREAVLKRDGYKCVKCESKKNLETDHIKSWNKYPELRYEVNNGRTLCRSCHLKTSSIGQRGKAIKH